MLLHFQVPLLLWHWSTSAPLQLRHWSTATSALSQLAKYPSTPPPQRSHLRQTRRPASCPARPGTRPHPRPAATWQPLQAASQPTRHHRSQVEIKTKTKINSKDKDKLKDKPKANTAGGGPAGSEPPPLFYPLLPARPTLTHNLAGYDFFQPVRSSFGLAIKFQDYQIEGCSFVDGVATVNTSNFERGSSEFPGDTLAPPPSQAFSDYQEYYDRYLDPLILHLWFFIWLLCIIMLLCKISKMISSPKTYKKASLHLRRDCPCPHWAPPIPRLLIEGWLTAFPFEEKAFPIPFETVHFIVLSFPQFHHVVELRWRKRSSPSQVTTT